MAVSVVVGDPAPFWRLKFFQLFKNGGVERELLMQDVGSDDSQGQLVGRMNVMLLEEGIGEATSLPKSQRLTEIVIGFGGSGFGFRDGGEQKQISVALPSFQDIGSDALGADDFAAE